MAKLKRTLVYDLLFKKMFVDHPGLLKDLVSALMGISLESISKFMVINSEIPPGALGEKHCRLDVNMTVDGQRIALEVQARDEGDFPERTLYYWAKDYTSSISSGDDYQDLSRAVIFSIIDFKLFSCKEYRSEFQILEVSRFEPLCDKMALAYFELPKVSDEIDPTDRLWLWLSLFKAKTKEDLERIRALEVPIMVEAIEAYESTTSSSEFRELERLRERARHNEAAALRHARNEGIKEGERIGEQKGTLKGERLGELRAKLNIAKSLLEFNIPIDKISVATGLAAEEIEKFSNW